MRFKKSFLTVTIFLLVCSVICSTAFAASSKAIENLSDPSTKSTNYPSSSCDGITFSIKALTPGSGGLWESGDSINLSSPIYYIDSDQDTVINHYGFCCSNNTTVASTTMTCTEISSDTDINELCATILTYGFGGQGNIFGMNSTEAWEATTLALRKASGLGDYSKYNNLTAAKNLYTYANNHIIENSTAYLFSGSDGQKFIGGVKFPDDVKLSAPTISVVKEPVFSRSVVYKDESVDKTALLDQLKSYIYVTDEKDGVLSGTMVQVTNLQTVADIISDMKSSVVSCTVIYQATNSQNINSQKEVTATIYMDDTNPATNVILGSEGYIRYIGLLQINSLSETSIWRKENNLQKLYAALSSNQYTTISKQPDDQSVSVGSNVTFKIEAVGDSLNYQWQVSKDNETTWEDLTDETAKTSNCTITVESKEYVYRCKITDAKGNETYSRTVKVK